MGYTNPMRYSRLHKAAYETDEDLRAEAEQVSAFATVLAPHSDAEIIVVSSKVRVDASFLEHVPSARLIITPTSGYEHLELAELRARGIRAVRLPQARRDAVVEASLECLMWGLGRVGELEQAALEGRWVRGELPELGRKQLAGSSKPPFQ